MKLVLESGDSWEQGQIVMVFLTAIDTMAQGQREAGRHLLNELSTTLEHMARDALLALSHDLRPAQEDGWQGAVSKPEGTPTRGRPPVLPPPYVLDYAGGSEDNPTMSIRSRSSRGAGASLRDPRDARLAYWLGKVHTSGPPFHVPKAMVCAIYCGTTALPDTEIVEKANMRVQSFKRRLARDGIDPHALVDTVRGAGWKLHPTVHLGRGFRSVFPYTPGFGGAYRGRDLLDDLPDQRLEEDDLLDDLPDQRLEEDAEP
jgi:hypothetical protein